MQAPRRFEPGTSVHVKDSTGGHHEGILRAWTAHGVIVDDGVYTLFLPYTNLVTMDTERTVEVVTYEREAATA